MEMETCFKPLLASWGLDKGVGDGLVDGFLPALESHLGRILILDTSYNLGASLEDLNILHSAFGVFAGEQVIGKLVSVSLQSLKKGEKGAREWSQ